MADKQPRHYSGTWSGQVVRHKDHPNSTTNQIHERGESSSKERSEHKGGRSESSEQDTDNYLKAIEFEMNNKI